MTPVVEAAEPVEPPHPLGVAAGQVVVHGDDVDAAPGERVQDAGQRRDEGLALAGLHLGDLAVVEHLAADELDVEVAHAERAHAGLAHQRERLGQQVVERAPLCCTCSFHSPTRRGNSSVESAFIRGSSSFTRATIGRSFLSSRSFFVPRIFFRT